MLLHYVVYVSTIKFKGLFKMSIERDKNDFSNDSISIFIFMDMA
jgi:hypothetical protein